MASLTRLDKASVTAIKVCMGAKKNENILIITDELKREIGYSLFENAKRLGYKSLLVEMEPGDRKSTRLNSSHIPLSRMPSSA